MLKEVLVRALSTVETVLFDVGSGLGVGGVRVGVGDVGGFALNSNESSVVLVYEGGGHYGGEDIAGAVRRDGLYAGWVETNPYSAGMLMMVDILVMLDVGIG